MIGIYELRVRNLIGRSVPLQETPLRDWLLFDAGRTALFFFLAFVRERFRVEKVFVNAYTTDVVHSTIRSVPLEVVPLDIDALTLATVPPPSGSCQRAVYVETGLFGFHAQNPEFYAGVRAEGGIVLEDCCNSFGSRCRLEEAGSLGDAAMYSFRIGKALSTGGGALRVNSTAMRAELAERYAKVPSYGSGAAWMHHLRVLLDYVAFEPWVLGSVSRPLRSLQQSFPALRGLVRGGVVDTVTRVEASSMRRMGSLDIRFARRRLAQQQQELAVRQEVSEKLCLLLGGLPLYVYAAEPRLAEGWNRLFFPLLLKEGEPDGFIRHLRSRGFDATRFHAKVPAGSFGSAWESRLPGTAQLCRRLVCIPNTTRMRGREKRLATAAQEYFRLEKTPAPEALRAALG